MERQGGQRKRNGTRGGPQGPAERMPAVAANERQRPGQNTRAADAPAVIVETVPSADAAAVLARWGERLARLGRERLRGDRP